MNDSVMWVKRLPENMKVENQDSQPADTNESRLYGTCSGIVHGGQYAINIFLYKHSVYNRIKRINV
jgi:hypothetical protein